MISETVQKTIIDTLKPYQPAMIGVFGSYVRGESNADSDLDILVEFTQTVDLLTIIALEQELSDRLGLRLDLITKKALPSQLEIKIDQDLQRIY